MDGRERTARLPADPVVRYEFLVHGDPDPHIRASFPEMGVRAGPVGGTTVFGEVLDQAHLHGLLARFENLAVTVVEMRQLPD